MLEFLINILHVYMLASAYLLSPVGLGYRFQGILVGLWDLVAVTTSSWGCHEPFYSVERTL